MFDYIKFIIDGFESQQKYDEAAGRPGPNDPIPDSDRFAKVIEYLGHLIEEAHEARFLVPRRTWKRKEVSYLDNIHLRKEFIAEMYDILLFHRAVLVYAGITPAEFLEAIEAKEQHNKTREDHKING